MPDRYDATLDTLRQSLSPDPAAVDRIIAGALAPRKSSLIGRRLIVIVVLLAAGATAILRLRPGGELAAGSLNNEGDIFVTQSPAGIWIHNNPEPEPATFQIISTGANR